VIALQWKPLPSGPLGAVASIPGIDAALVWADASGWRDFIRPDEGPPEIISIVGEVASGGLAALKARLNGAAIPNAYQDEARYFTGRFSRDELRAAIRSLGKEGGLLRLELQSPYIPLRPRTDRKLAAPSRVGPAPVSSSRVLIGVLDQGCPFAHAGLRTGLETRVLSVWLQDDRPDPRALSLGVKPLDFGYGVQLHRQSLNALIADHADGGVVDEAACHEAAGLTELRRRYAHGAAVLSAIAGRRPPEIRLPGDSATPPSLSSLDDEASKSDLVFVQGPWDTLQDSSSGALGRYMLDALRYVVSCAGPRTEKIVINISDGSSRGSHDGRWLLTEALADVVANPPPRKRIHVTIPAGNTANERRHAQFNDLAPGVWTGVDMRVSPATETATQIVIRLPAEADNVRIRVIPPGKTADSRGADIVGRGQAKCWKGEGGIECAVIYPVRAVNDRSVLALITLAPTVRWSSAQVVARGGDWRIELQSTQAIAAPVHFYIPRTQQNEPAPIRGRQARFVDKSSEGWYDPRRWLSELDRDPVPPMSPIRRSGTLNGLATGTAGEGVEVVGGIFHLERKPVPYSSQGPSVGLDPSGQRPPSREKPDLNCPSDLSCNQRGIVAGGTTSGQVVRVRGTSFAAPQRAREIVNKP
jgi:hypothetical protein